MYKLNSEKYLNDIFFRDKNILQRKEIVKEVTNYYSKNKDIIGIILVGSLQGIPRDKFSDFDFFIIYNKRPPILANRIQFINEIVGSNFIYAFNYISNEYGISDDFSWNDIEVCTSFYSLEQMRKYIEDVHTHTDYKRKGFYYPMAFVAAVADGLILYEKSKIITDYKFRCKIYPDRLKYKILTEEKGFLDYYQDRMTMALYRKDYVYFEDLIHLFIDSALQTIFSFNKVYFYSKKEIEKKLCNLDQKPDDFYINLTQLLEIDNLEKNYNKKKEITQKIAFSLEKYNSFLPDQVDIYPANDSTYAVTKRNWLISAGVVTAAIGIAFFKINQNNCIGVIPKNISLQNMLNK